MIYVLVEIHGSYDEQTTSIVAASHDHGKIEREKLDLEAKQLKQSTEAKRNNDLLDEVKLLCDKLEQQNPYSIPEPVFKEKGTRPQTREEHERHKAAKDSFEGNCVAWYKGYEPYRNNLLTQAQTMVATKHGLTINDIPTDYTYNGEDSSWDIEEVKEL